jgi:hypothetical protein
MHSMDVATLLWDWFVDKGVRMSKLQACNLLDITPNQFTRGLETLRDMFQEDREDLVVVDPRTHEYFAPSQWSDARDYVYWNLKCQATRARRTSSTLAAAAMKFPNDLSARRAARHMAVAADDLNDMLDVVVNGHAPAGA